MGTLSDVAMGFGYAAVGLLSVRRARPSALERRASVLHSYWWWVGIGLIAIGMARIGAAERAVDRIRAVAYQEGWYDARADFQVGALIMLGACGGVAATLSGRQLDPVARRHAIAVGALVMLAGARVISLHGVDQMLLTKPFGFLTVAYWAEIVALLAAGAISRHRSAG